MFEKCFFFGALKKNNIEYWVVNIFCKLFFVGYHVTNLNVLQTSTAHEIIGHFEGEHADLVVCDGAPDGNISDYYNNYPRPNKMPPSMQGCH